MRNAVWLVAAIGLFPLRAQDGAALAQRESKLTARSIEALNKVADSLQAQKQHYRAMQMRREILADLDENNLDARAKLGFVRFGAQWRRDPNVLVLDKDLAGDTKAVKKIEQELDTLARDLGNEHKALAEGFTTQQNPERAQRQWKRLLRWQPSDKAAITALALASFEGFRATPNELSMLRRSRSIRGAVEWLHRAPFDAQRMEGEQLPLLTNAGVDHIGVRSEHFQVWGSLPEATMIKLAQYAERALLMCHTLMGTSTGKHFEPAKRLDVVFVPSNEAYVKILDSCAEQLSNLDFLKTLDLAFVRSEGRDIRIYRSKDGEELSLDQLVRGISTDAIGTETHGIWEGMGHAACGFMFNRTMTFLMDKKIERTATAAPKESKLPDLETWRKLAEESAWAKTDTRTSELVLLSAAKFTDEQRVKAWAMCDYLMITHPEFVVDLDRSKTPKIVSPVEVEQEFLARTKVALPTIDDEWREYWARGAVLRAAMGRDPLGPEKAPERQARIRARTLVDEVNTVRAAAMRGPVGFYLADSTDSADAVAYTERLQKAEAERKRGLKQKPPVDVPLPPLPPTFGLSVLWSRREKPADAVHEWMLQPALRDVLLHAGRGLAGSAVSPNAWVLDVALPAMSTRTGMPQLWPRNGQVGVTSSVRVGDLGPRAIAALAASGKQPDDLVGPPLTLHFARSVPPAQLGLVTCKVYTGSMGKPGVLVVYETEATTPDSAPGCVAFVPLEPLPVGALEIVWQLPPHLIAKDTPQPEARFTTK